MIEAKTPPARQICTFCDGEFTQIFTVGRDRATGGLYTDRFREVRKTVFEVRHVQRAEWETTVPEEARIFAGSAGLLNDDVETFWLGWTTPSGSSVLSVFSGAEIPLLPAGETPIGTPVITPRGELRVYSWRATDDGAVLLRHTVRQAMGEQAEVTSEERVRLSAVPAISTCVPVPGFESGAVALAWAEERPDGVVITAAFEEHDELALSEARPAAEIELGDPSTMSIHVGLRGRLAVGAVVRSARSGRPVFLESSHDFEAGETDALVVELDLAGRLRAASVCYLRDVRQTHGTVLLVDAKGVLWRTNRDGTELSALREGVESDYDFPVIATKTGLYEARPGEHDDIEFLPLR